MKTRWLQENVGSHGETVRREMGWARRAKTKTLQINTRCHGYKELAAKGGKEQMQARGPSRIWRTRRDKGDKGSEEDEGDKRDKGLQGESWGRRLHMCQNN